ncbi:hypothetical protein [Manganibacter manganicus]|uniref:Uncharacterized protein n=1 Tax=Manganibacter manganicus TaxID=1873176 RepID=A0A1V8RNZ8_9HYPH|nr:hypothetical protein [Pseudaminobacter manganicus]OQM74932.1 hypothetical protein BFN67_04775 [Pseudaminobacter manganicus]
MSNPYIKETIVDRSCIGNPVPRIDRDFLMRDFAFDLATELAMNVENADDLQQSYAGAWIDCGNDLTIFVNAEHGAKIGRVKVGAFTGLVRKLDSNGPKMPSATYDAARPMAAIAKAIRKNIIDVARPLVDGLREQVKERVRSADEFGALIHLMEMRFPGLQINRKNPNDLTAEIYINNGAGYASGTLYTDGRISFQRVSAYSRESSDAILSAIAGKRES